MFKRVGITGSRHGASFTQLGWAQKLLSELQNQGAEELHHGDCLGVDAQVAKLALKMGYRLICHPPASDYMRAFVESHEYRKPLHYLVRDKNIVDESDILLAFPLEEEEQPKGGTWYTYRYSRSINKDSILVTPKGTMRLNNGHQI